MNNELIDDITLKTRKLSDLKILLKEKFFGIDNQIDRIVDSMRTWYIMPSIIRSPIIINLWSLTGNGKTDLVRTIVDFLQFNNKFCEIQLSDTAESGGTDKIAKLILSSGCKECEPSVILLDEFQRYRTITSQGQDIGKLPYQDIWLLLSDGKFPVDDKKQKEHSSLAKQLGFEWKEVKYDDIGNVTSEAPVNMDEDEELVMARSVRYRVKRTKSQRVSYLYLPRTTDKHFGAHEDGIISRIVDFLDNRVPEKTVSNWTYLEALKEINLYAENRSSVYDFTQSLIFVAGNLDEAFQVAGDVDNCDTNADIFHEYTKRVSIIEIKRALTTRFKPEQISRLGNNHIIYPSLNKEAYMKIINRACQKYLNDANNMTDIKFELHDSVIEEIYANAVYPTQGTRPVFSSIHMMFGAPLSNGILWAMEHGYSNIIIQIFFASSCITFIDAVTKNEICVPIQFQLRERKDRHGDNFRALVSVHEMGHAILHTKLFKEAPEEIKINVAAFDGGYNRYRSNYPSAKDILDRICVGFGGIAAEEEIFGVEYRSTGAESDISSVTLLASAFVRRWGMSDHKGRIDISPLQTVGAYIYDIANTDALVENILIEQKQRAKDYIKRHRQFLINSSNDLLIKKEFTSQEFMEYAKDEFTFDPVRDRNKVDTLRPYADMLSTLISK